MMITKPGRPVVKQPVQKRPGVMCPDVFPYQYYCVCVVYQNFSNLCIRVSSVYLSAAACNCRADRWVTEITTRLSATSEVKVFYL